jgi:hypothetical protein
VKGTAWEYSVGSRAIGVVLDLINVWFVGVVELMLVLVWLSAVETLLVEVDVVDEEGGYIRLRGSLHILLRHSRDEYGVVGRDSAATLGERCVPYCEQGSDSHITFVYVMM